MEDIQYFLEDKKGFSESEDDHILNIGNFYFDLRDIAVYMNMRILFKRHIRLQTLTYEIIQLMSMRPQSILSRRFSEPESSPSFET